MTQLISGSTCEVQGAHTWSSPLFEPIIETREETWEACAAYCRTFPLCSMWIYLGIGCYLQKGDHVPYTGSADVSTYMIGYRDCTPGKILQ